MRPDATDEASDATADSSPQLGEQGDAATDARVPSAAAADRSVLEHMKRDKVEALLWLSRLATVVFAILYLVPTSVNAYGHYQRVLLSTVVTSALRLNQRLPRIQLSRAFLSGLVGEDSFHYLCFAFMFLNMSAAISLAVMPVTLFAVLQSVNYTWTVLDLLGGPSSFVILRKLLYKIEQQQTVLLRFAACAEVFMMPTTLLLVLSGQAVFVLPVIYYRFLRLRYDSARNPYCRAIVLDMRVRTEQLCRHPYCPDVVRTVLLRLSRAAERSSSRPHAAASSSAAAS